jgi:hypothetical protein
MVGIDRYLHLVGVGLLCVTCADTDERHENGKQQRA